MSNRRGNRNGPNVGQQATQDHSLVTGRRGGNRREEGKTNKRGNKAIADLAKKPVGGSVIHHCAICGGVDTVRCLAKGHIEECRKCGEYKSAGYNTECRSCVVIQMTKDREERKAKEEEEKQAAALEAKKAMAEAHAGKRKPRHSAMERDKRAQQQTAQHDANTRRQIARAQAIAKFIFAPRPVGVRKRTGRVGDRLLYDRAPGRPAHTYRRHTVSGPVSIDSSSSADEMDEEEDGWEDVDVEADAVGEDDAARQLQLEEDAALQRRIGEALDRLRS